MLIAPVHKHRTRSHRKPPATKQIQQEAHVLCVDDDDDLTRVIKARLQDFKIDVSRAGSGREGLRLARSHRPKAIITDLNMSKGDGEYLFRRLKSRPSTASIPIIVISGIDDPERVARAYQLGACAVLKKPFHFEQLFEVLLPHVSGVPMAHTSTLDANMTIQTRQQSSQKKFCFDAAHSHLKPVTFSRG